MNSIPTNLDEAVSKLSDMFSEKDIEYFKTKNVNTYHNTLGRWIRNEWGLWGDSNPELKKWFWEKGIRHPDDMSSVILDATQAKLNGRDFDLNSRVEHFNQYSVLERCM